MWSWLYSRAEAADEPTPAAEEPAAVEPEQPAAEQPAEPAPAVEESAEAPAPAEEPAPEPEPVVMKEPTKAEIEAAKAEIVTEVVDKIVSSMGDDILGNEVVTAPYDPRFPATNQARHCFVRYNEYYKCVFERSAESERCAFYKRAYESMCPEEWVEQWEELREKGLWMGKY